MKQQKEIIKIAPGILAGAVAVMIAIGVMLNMVLHPFIIILVLIVLFGIAAIVAGVMMEFKGIIMVVASFVFGWFGFNAYYHHACGPNSADVKVMKPMAEAISNYIVKHGVPKSLKDIPDLPYELEGCEKKIYYLDKASRVVNDEQYANELHIKEICRTKYDIKIEQRIDKMFIGSKEIFLQISLKNQKTETGAVFSWVKDGNSNHFTVFQKLKFYSGNTSGICKPWRQ